LQWLAENCVKRPVFALMLTMAMVVAGAVAYRQLGVDRFPQMDLPTIAVSTIYPGASPYEIESEISQPLEDAVATVAGIDELRSISSEGQSLVLLTFRLDRDIDAAAQDVRDAVNAVLNRLPPRTYPPTIRKVDLDSSPIISLAVSGPREPRELFLYADRHVKNVLESAKGVGEVRVVGSSERAIQVNIGAQRLAAYQVSINQVHQALVRQNAEVPGGRVDAGARELGLRTLGRLEHPDEFNDLVVATVNGTPVKIKDLGEAVDDQKELRNFARLNGQPAVVVTIQRQSGENTIEVIDAIKARLPRCQELLPENVKIEVIQDQSRYIHAAMHEVQQHLILGGILASLVVLVFMRSWRSMLIAAVAIPTSIIATFAAMRALDFTLNNVTLLALVLMVGVVIDDAIVVLENVFHWIEEKGASPMEAAVLATREIGLAVLATTISLVIVFLPVAFLSSVTGRMLHQFGVTATVAILISMIISFSLTPMMCSRLLKAVPKRDIHGKPGTEPASRGGFYQYIDRFYAWCLRFSLRNRLLVLLLCLAVIAANVPLYRIVKQDYVPTNVDESEFEVSITAPEGLSLQSMAVVMTEVEKEVRSVPGVETVLTTVGGRGISRVNVGDLYVRLTDINQRTFNLGRLASETRAGQPGKAFTGNFSQREKMTEVRRRLAKFKDLRIGVRNQTSLRQGAPVDIDFVLTGPDLKRLAQYSDQLRAKVAQLPGIVDTDTTLRLNKPELLVDINRPRAAALGVDVQEIADTLRLAVGGDDRVSRFYDAALDDAFDVELRLSGLDRGNKESISQLYVRTRPSLATATRGMPTPSGTANTIDTTRLDNVVTFRFEDAPARIDRLDRTRMSAVRANIIAGHGLADRIAAVQQAARELGMPVEYSSRVMGRGRELERTFIDFVWTFALAFVFMYIVLAAQYEHLIHPLTILLSLPLAVPFGLVSLLLGAETLNLYSALGILVLLGVVKKASILQVDHTNQLRERGMETNAAILQANRDRLRPILMTTIAFVAGMLPLLIGKGPGAEERRSIAVLAVGGQTLSLLLTLVAVPVLYSLLDDLGRLIWRSKKTSVEPPKAEVPVEVNHHAASKAVVPVPSDVRP
jgi:hydrophobic/amphiphilic exporter-1 (mainly G- bacteria), HAE1 family